MRGAKHPDATDGVREGPGIGVRAAEAVFSGEFGVPRSV